MFGRVLLNLNTKGIRFVLVLLSLGVLLLFYFTADSPSKYLSRN